MTISDLIVAFGGVNAMARALGLTHAHISYWGRVGYIPLKRHNKVLEAAAKHRIRLTREHLSRQIEKASPRQLGGAALARARTPEVMELHHCGFSSKEIAARLSISYPSVRRIVTGSYPNG